MFRKTFHSCILHRLLFQSARFFTFTQTESSAFFRSLDVQLPDLQAPATRRLHNPLSCFLRLRTCGLDHEWANQSCLLPGPTGAKRVFPEEEPEPEAPANCFRTPFVAADRCREKVVLILRLLYQE